MSPSAEAPEMRGYRLTVGAGGKAAFDRVHRSMLLKSPVALERFRGANVSPALALFSSGLPRAAGVGLAWTSIAGIFAAVELMTEGSQVAFLIGERLLPDSIFQEELSLAFDGRPLCDLRLSDLGNPGEVLPWLASAAGGIEPGQIVFLGGQSRARLGGQGTLLVSTGSGGALVARVEG